MILINLLPHREARRQQRKKAFFAGLALAAIVGFAIVGGWYTIVVQLISNQDQRNSFLSGEIKRLDAQIADVAGLKAEIEALKARQKAVEDLQADRNMPVYLLNELVTQTPEGVFDQRSPVERPASSGHGPRADQRTHLRIPAQHGEQLALARRAVVLTSIKAADRHPGWYEADQRRMFDFADERDVEASSRAVGSRTRAGRLRERRHAGRRGERSVGCGSRRGEGVEQRMHAVKELEVTDALESLLRWAGNNSWVI